MKYWWVNQKQTFECAVKAGYLWSPKSSAEGRNNPFYDHMTQVRPGDVVFAFADRLIKAIAIVNGDHYSKDRPEEFNSTDNTWRNDGWAVPVEYTAVEKPLMVRNFMHRIGPLLPPKYSPLQANGNANQAYLFPVPDPMGIELLTLLNIDPADLSEWQEDVRESSTEDAIRNDGSLTETEKEQLIKARRGQGIFRKNVNGVEKACRVTGTADPGFLIASHIKPWAKSDNHERLDGSNGLMLAPHIDRLFDRGYISFHDNGALILSAALPDSVRVNWGLEQKRPLTPFSAKQAKYLKYHRDELLRQ
ncbi:MAG: hypothetical protein GAK31_03238 [Stenotrophomonas maltophilia]|uniref:HNH nuclease domain-containing protein n=1 Tax=Stenotrophomonas maltophilia TaxID=40324 RepID=A0A7V8FF51_STEMA|nr:MAG: hypothetical protein GAK31_03238 [Stenotrophomonas maltophilia]